jgi:hypothetical protein
MTQDIDDDRYGQIARAVLQRFGISSPTPWAELGATRQRPYIAAARAVIEAWQRDHAPRDEDGVPEYPDGGGR